MATGISRFIYDPKTKEWTDTWTDVQKKVGAAATAAMREVGETAVREGRWQIASAGFDDGYFPWQTGFVSETFPRGGKPSLRPATRVRHKIGLTSVFEFGATFGPKKRSLLWLPIEKNLPPGFRGGPKKFRGKLYSVEKASGRPLLVGRKSESRERVPMFIGVPAVTLRKRFKLLSIIKAATDRLEEYYLKNFKG